VRGPQRGSAIEAWSRSVVDSRIALTENRDALGMQRVKLDWRFSELDDYSFLRTLELFGQELGRSNLGRLLLCRRQLRIRHFRKYPANTYNYSASSSSCTTHQRAYEG
jgi:hypothetical protein